MTTRFIDTLERDYTVHNLATGQEYIVSGPTAEAALLTTATAYLGKYWVESNHVRVLNNAIKLGQFAIFKKEGRYE